MARWFPPRINTITGGNSVITGSFADKEAIELAANLENPLAAPQTSGVSAGVVDPSMGKDAVASGIRAAIIGTLAVAAFMVVYFLLAGAVANVALLLQHHHPSRRPLLDRRHPHPSRHRGYRAHRGYGGRCQRMIRRMREELAAGKSVRGAVAAGYSKAFGTIFDSNLTTMICGSQCC